MVTITTVSGATAAKTAMESTITTKVSCIKGNGMIIKNMVRVKTYSQMAHVTKGTSKMVNMKATLKSYTPTVTNI